ncbi:MAG TPA: hypothetical protein VHB25_06240 [Gemmatimonadaceae bacterium]|nr:hypothetical protein [Gemmatimonadaceae bacterium]
MTTLSLPFRRAAAGLLIVASAAPVVLAQSSAPVDPQLYAGLHWRNLGPFRGGRTAAVTGAVGEPNVFYIGTPAGGVWKTTSAGQVWYPIFDSIKSASSVGAVAVAPSDPNVVYVGMGDIITGGGINEGDGMYKSTDAGKTWTHLGLENTKQIPSMWVDPHDPNIVLITAQGDVHHKSHDRGVFRTTDGGKTWTNTLFVNDSTGAQKIAVAYDEPNVMYVTTVAHYQAPPVPGQTFAGRGFGPGQNGPTDTKLFKSTDGGVTWKEITGGGFPHTTGKMWVAVANHTNAQRVFVVDNTGLYRSDDGGATWRQMDAEDPRVHNGQGGYNCGVYIDPQNPDIVYVLNTASYVSHDGGNTFTGFKGAPGGDDPQQMWIDPTNGQRILFGYDQGAIVSLDGGHTWSSWYNQPDEQIYHIAADNSFPYWVYGSQQDAGAIRVRSRGNLGAITPLDWNPVPGWEWGTETPDPLDPNIVYASGSGILKITYPSEQWINVSPASDPSRQLRATSDAPMKFAPWNKHMLIAAFQSLWSTTDGGAHWTALSPDLTLRPGEKPPVRGSTPNFRGGAAIQSLSLSNAKAGVIWAGTNNGLVKVSKDGGKTWQDASVSDNIPNADRAEVFSIEASNFDPAEAYAVYDLYRLGDYTPYVYRTRDYGKTWTRITNGLPTGQASGSFARFVRNDTQRKGLLFAGTESGMYVSFDDGDHWQSLQQNLPNTSYRDGFIKDNDLVVTTYGRGIWVLDDVSPLRQVSAQLASAPAHLFKPGAAYRLRRNVGADTPFPPEVPHAENPAPGAMIDYYLASAPSSDITLDVLDASGNVVRHLTSAPGTPVPEAKYPPEPNFWLAPPFALPKNAGENRTNWDLRYDSPMSFSHSFEINANPGETPPSPEGPLVQPGTYTLKLTVDGKAYTQTVNVKADPRSPATPAALAAEHALEMKLLQGANAAYEGHQMAVALREALRGNTDTRVAGLLAQIDTIVGLDAQRGRGRGFGPPARPSFTSVNGAMVRQLEALDNGDFAPNAAMLAAYAQSCKELSTLVTAWQRVAGNELAKGHVSGALKAPSCTP